MCETCDRFTAEMDARRGHTTRHNTRVWNCTECGKTTMYYLGPWAVRRKGGKGYEKISDTE